MWAVDPDNIFSKPDWYDIIRTYTDLTFTVVDPHRPGHEMRYYPGNTSLRLADAVIINKIDSASPEGIEEVKKNIHNVMASRFNVSQVCYDSANSSQIRSAQSTSSTKNRD